MPVKTRADQLRFGLSRRLAKAVKVIRGMRQALTWQERDTIADETVKHMAELPDNPWRLREELPSPTPAVGHGTPEVWCKPKSDMPTT
jgi:hypothetical protein